MHLKGFEIRSERLEIGTGVSNRGRDYKSEQERLRTGADISNQRRNYKSVQIILKY